MMWKFEIPATARTPAVTFDFAENRLKLTGEVLPRGRDRVLQTRLWSARRISCQAG